MSPSELMLGKEARKLMDLTIPMGCKEHFYEAMKMIKRLEKINAQTKKLLEKVQKRMRSMLTKHISMLNLKLGNTCG